MASDTDSLSNILSNLDIGGSSVLATPDKNHSEVDTLEGFKKEFIKFLSNNPDVVTNSRYVASKDKSLVVLSPLSTKHSFGRTWVSKTYQSTIVERPQRLLACSLGIAAAVSMYPSHYTLLSSIKKSPLTSPHVLKIHGKNWPADIEKICKESEAKLAKGEIEVPDDWNSGDIYLTKGSLDALTGVIGAVETAVDNIFKKDEDTPRRAFVAIRPPGHHSHPCVPSGFCLINNAQIAAEYAAVSQGVTHAVILDFDLHHGDGTQDICWQKAGFQPEFGESEAGYETPKDDKDDEDNSTKKPANTPKVGYFSLHDINSFPTELGYAIPSNIKNASTCITAHDLNIWNVHLQPYEEEKDFYVDYQERYSVLLKKADEFLSNQRKEYERLKKNHKKNQPELPPFKAFIIISAGFDASEYEVQSMQRHGVHVPTSFYAKFTSDSIKLAKKHSDGILLSLLEGGYSDGALVSGVFSHLIGLQGQRWEQAWGSSEVVKELIKGCRPKWTPLKQPSNEIKHWANQVCQLGRVMVPDSIIHPPSSPNNVTSTPNHGDTSRVSRSTRSHSALPANKMVSTDNLESELISSTSVTPEVEVKKESPIAESSPTPLGNNNSETTTGEFKHKFVKVDGEWKVSPLK